MGSVKNIMVSACLLGVSCRYDGRSKEYEGIPELIKEEGIRLIPVCPEQLGGLSTPRYPSEIRDGKVINNQGDDVTTFFQRGAMEALKLCRIYQADCALLKEKSPSCGCGQIYDGSFSGKLKEGYGVTAELLKSQGIRLFGESRLEELKAFYKEYEKE